MLNQVCHMGILTDGKVCYVDKVQPQSPIPLISYIGKLSNIHSTALGKVLVSEFAGQTNAKEDLSYSNPKATPKWFETAKKNHGKAWVTHVKKQAGGC